MRKVVSGLSILLGLLAAYLAVVGISGLALSVVGNTSGPLVMRIGQYGVTSETVMGGIVCGFITVAFLVSSWILLSVVPKKLLKPESIDRN